MTQFNGVFIVVMVKGLSKYMHIYHLENTMFIIDGIIQIGIIGR